MLHAQNFARGCVQSFFFAILPCTIAIAAYAGHFPIRPYKTSTPPKIDGLLDEEAWTFTRLDTLFLTYQPTYGDSLPFRTLVHVAYDSKNLYFAFECLDKEPDKIKTSITQRDQIFSDDWVGLSLDALGNKQHSYDLFVNANGIQADILNTPNEEDVSPDWVWDSAGRKTETGYQVEIRLPLKSLQYQSGAHVIMGILFWRKISRLGLSGAFPELKPGESTFTSRMGIPFEQLDAPQSLQLLPSITAAGDRERATPDRWHSADTNTDVGISIKYSVTSTMSAEATINPDFSQVESDAFQVQVNQRYPIFYTEKRPFFMEAGSLFNMAGTSGDNNMTTAMHTRKIDDPDWGARLTASQGRTSYAVLTARDGWTEFKEDSLHNDDKAYCTILRGKYTLRDESYLGALLSDRTYGDGYNRVAGVDLNYRFLKKHTLMFNHLQSFSRNPVHRESTRGSATVINYMYFTKPLGIWTSLENYDPHFNMETAFYLRSAFRRAQMYIGPAFYPTHKKWSWLQRINPFLFANYLRDLNTGHDDHLLVTALRLATSRQGQIRVDYVRLRENWQNKDFQQYWWRSINSLQAFNWLKITATMMRGHGIRYSDDPCLGKERYDEFTLTLQPNSKLSQSLGYTHSHMDGLAGQGELFNDDIINSRTTYQFNKYFFLRGIVQYDSYTNKTLTDFLASFTFIPGTVLFLGYGSLYERREWQDDRWLMQQGPFREIRQSLFFKASYLWRI
jgi:hypothetical protein